MRILLVGGSGFVGKNLFYELITDNEVKIMSRSRPSWLKQENWTAGDIRDPSTMDPKVLKSFDIVVDLVGLINQKLEKHHDVNVKGTGNLIEALGKNSGTKLVYISAINSDVGTTEYFKTKKEAERNVISYGNYVIIRPSVLYGQDDYLTSQLVKASRQLIPIFPKSKPLYPVYIGDFARVFSKIMMLNGSFDVCSDEPLTMGDMLNIVREEQGKGPLPQAPLWVFKTMAPVLDFIGLISSEQLSMLGYDFYREDTVLKRYVAKPTKYKDFILTQNLKPKV